MIKSFLFLTCFGVLCFGLGLDSAFNSCTQNNQNTQTQAECIKALTAQWDSLLNNNYKMLIRQLDSVDKEKLRIAQRNWVTFKENEIEFLNQAFAWNPQTTGTIVKLYRVQFIMEATKNRSLMLENYLKALEDSSKE